jgi:mevalonate kinase
VIASVPGKVFLLGEYAVLGARPALVAALAPRFELVSGDRAASARALRLNELHPRSPAGRLLSYARERGVSSAASAADLGFVDPFQGQGGFGASTAQFALAYTWLAHDAGWELSALGARRVYRELMADEKLPPSGADLIAQWSGGVVGFDAGRGEISQRSADLDWTNLLVFSAAGQPGRKVPTHEHLALLASGRALDARVGSFFDEELLNDLSRTLARADSALLAGDPRLFGASMGEYARALAGKGLEIEAARADREALSALPGVLGAKGTGALLADAVVVLLDESGGAGAGLPGSADTARERVIREAEARGLRLVADGLGAQPEAGLSALETVLR